jgi:diguanylate cyclase (GGDEF)-like protein
MKYEYFLNILNRDQTGELQKAILELLAREQDHQIQDALFKELINEYAVVAKQLEKKVNEVTWLSQTDSLTQIYNRHKLTEIFPMESAKAKFYGTELAVILFDIDHFKKINDTYGHETGDIVLVELTQLVRSMIRKNDLFVRWGGEEFLLLLPDALDEVRHLAERIRKQVMEFSFTSTGTVTISLGVAAYAPDSDTIDTLVSKADSVLYRAKLEGRNRVEVYIPSANGPGETETV